MATVEQLYRALRAKGASAVQAAGITGNAVSEVGPSTSDLSPDSELNINYYEAACMGFVCWTTPGYSPPRPTGHPAVDLDNQIDYLKQTGGFEHATGVDAMSAGRNFALNYERCAECFFGGSQFIARGEQAAAVARLAALGGWDTPPTPVKSYHYDLYPEGAVRTAAERYDALRRVAHRTLRQRAWLRARQFQCARYARGIARNANGAGGWGRDDRRFLYDALTARGRGETVQPTV
jgi:hypothetical protein